MNKTCILVLGMHRSGTSALSGSLSVLGVHQGANLVEAVEGDNPKGYWEPREVVSINNDIFDAFNMHYMDYSSFPDDWLNDDAIKPIRHRIKSWLTHAFTKESLLSIKDPRLCRTLPIWVEELEGLQVDIKYIHIFRHPMEVVASLRVRDDTFSIAKGLLSWLAHVLGSFDVLSGKHVLVSYASLINHPVETLSTIGDKLGVNWPAPARYAADALDVFLEKSLVHQRFEGKIPFPPLGHLIGAVFECVLDRNLQSPNKHFYSSMNDYKSSFKEYDKLFVSILADLKGQLEAEKMNAKEQIEYRDALLAEKDALLAEKDALLHSRKKLLRHLFKSLLRKAS